MCRRGYSLKVMSLQCLIGLVGRSKRLQPVCCQPDEMQVALGRTFRTGKTMGFVGIVMVGGVYACLAQRYAQASTVVT